MTGTSIDQQMMTIVSRWRAHIGRPSVHDGAAKWYAGQAKQR